MKELQISVHSEELTLREWMQEICPALGFVSRISSVNSCFVLPAAYQWLVQEGYAVEEPGEDPKHPNYRPTAKGSGHGLRCYERKYENWDTNAVRISCAEQGQKFLLDNVEQITAVYQQWQEPLLACLTPGWYNQNWDLPQESTVTDLVKRINSRLPADLPWKINRTLLNDWLFWKGFLKEISKRTQKGRISTAAGEELGIHTETFSEEEWASTVVWKVSAQQFVLDNFETIVRDLFSGEPYRASRFAVTEEIQKGVRLSNKGIGTPKLAELINIEIQRSGSVFSLPWKTINKWLRKEGYLVWEKKPDNPLWSMVPTQRGQDIGLYLTGEKNWLKFDMNAQRFVVDNLQGIVDYYYKSL